MPIAVDQANLGEFALDSSVGSIALTTSATAASASFIVLTLTWFSATVTLSSVSGGGLGWAIDKQVTNVGGSGGICLAIVSAQAPSGLASGTTITATLSAAAGGARSLAGTSFTGVATSAALDTTSGATNQASGTAWASASTTIAAGSVLLGLAADFTSNDTSTITGPSIEAHDFGGGAATFEQTVGYRIEAAGGGFTVAGTWLASVANASVICAAYKQAASGVPTALAAVPVSFVDLRSNT